jgi:hypothetical protein
MDVNAPPTSYPSARYFIDQLEASTSTLHERLCAYRTRHIIRLYPAGKSLPRHFGGGQDGSGLIGVTAPIGSDANGVRYIFLKVDAEALRF